MEDWDQETLEKVVESKKNEYNHNKPTEIVSLLPSTIFSYSMFDPSVIMGFWHLVFSLFLFPPIIFYSAADIILKQN